MSWGKEKTHFWLTASLSFSSLPDSDAGFEPLALIKPSPSWPRRMIFFGKTAGGGVLLAETFGWGAIVASERGTRQKGVLNIRTEPIWGS